MANIVLFGAFSQNLQDIFRHMTSKGKEVFWEHREKALFELLAKQPPFLVVLDLESDRKNGGRPDLLQKIQTVAPNAFLLILVDRGDCTPTSFGDKNLHLPSLHFASSENFLQVLEKLLLKECGDHVVDGLPLFVRGCSEGMKRLESMANQITDTDATVLIQGESGVGKGVLASYLHFHSKRKDRPFLKVNCAALPGELLESELFGYERGAFTGANGSKPGKFECVKDGTILLDEIGELSMPMQAKLLHVLEDKRYCRLGAQQDIHVQARVLVATNRDLGSSVHKGLFRKDLFYRLQVVHLAIPPLRERREEIPILVDYFLEKYARQFERPKFSLSSDDLCLLVNHSWPGNVRQLENLVKRLVLFQDRRPLVEEVQSGDGFPEEGSIAGLERGGLREATRRICRETERNMILRTLEHTRWNRTTTAKILRVSYKTLLNKMHEYGLREVSRIWQEEAWPK